MTWKQRFLSLAVGAFFAGGFAICSSPAGVTAQGFPGCDNEKCLEACAGSVCTEGCTPLPEWECAGDDSDCYLSVMCPLES